MNRLHMLLLGTFGGLAPNLVGMGTEAVLRNPGPMGYMYADPVFWLGAVTLALVGGVLAAVLADGTLKSAMTLGATAPAFFLGLTQGVTRQSQPQHGASARDGPRGGGVHWLVTPAFAESRATVARGVEQDSIRWIMITGLQTAAGLDAHLLAVQPNGVELRTHLPARDTMVAVPAVTSQVYVVVAGARSDPVVLAGMGGNTVPLELDVARRTFLTSFGRAFGIRSNSVRPVLVAGQP